MGDFVGDQAGASGRSRVGGEKLTDWWARLSRLNPTLSPDLVASILAAGDGPMPNPPVVLPTLQFLVAFNNGPLDDPASITTVASPAGTLGAAGVWTDITPWVMGYQMGRGRRHELDQFEAGTVQLDLNNEDGRFNPWNTSSPYAGKLTIRKPLRVQATVGGNTYVRFTGHVDAWPTLWADPVTHFAELHATDAFRLFQGRDILNPGYPTLVAADGASSYWRFGDPVGSAQALDQIAGLALFPVSDAATPTFGGTGAMEADTGTCATFSTSGAGFAQLSQTTQSALASSTGITAEFWFREAAPGAATAFTVAMFINDGGLWFEQEVLVNGGSSPSVQVFLDANVTASVNVCDGLWHHIVGTATLASPSSVVIYVDGVQVATGTPAWTSSGDFANTVQLQTGGAASASIQELAVYPSVLTSTQVANHYKFAAFPQQSTDARIGHVLTAVGWPTGARNLDSNTTTVQAVTSPLTTTSSLSHMQDCQATEGGALYMGGDGKVNFRSRQTLWSGSVHTTSQATFGDGVGDIPWSPTPNLALDDIDLFNEARGQRTGGNTQVINDPTSIDTYGRSTWQPAGQLLGISDLEVQGLCQAVVNDHKTPQSRLQSIDVNLAGLTAAQQATVLGLGMLYRITAERSSVPGSAFSQVGLIEHISETARPGEWTVTFGLDTTGTEPYWVLGTSQLGVNTRLAW